MAEGKWIRGLTAEMPSREAARRVLEARLQVVLAYLPKAVEQSHRDTEHVHQLRVGTRRADAALRIFRPCLPRRLYRTARARLRSIRRAAGAARDWDVFLLGLQERLPQIKPNETSGFDCLIGMALSQRQQAQQAIQTIEPVEQVEQLAQELVEAVRDPDESALLQFVDLANLTIQHRLHALEESLGQDLTDYAHLHRVRITGKRLRYALEVLSECLPPMFRETIYPLIEQMQEILGRANDSHFASRQFVEIREQLKAWNSLRPRLRPGIEAVTRYHQRRLREERKRFERWLQQWRAVAPLNVLV